jgi:hypothetical protein
MLIIKLSGKAKQVFALLKFKAEKEGKKTLAELEVEVRAR